MPLAEKSEQIAVGEFAPTPTLGDRIDSTISFLRRRYLPIVIGLAVALPLGALYLFSQPAVYTATATMMIETRQSPLQQTMLGDVPPDTAWIESQIGVIKSQNVAAYIVKQLRLAEDPDFVGSSGPIGRAFDKVLRPFGWSSEPQTDAERFSQAVGAMGTLSARRIGASYMLRIDFTAGKAEQAARVANAVVDAYIFDQLNAKYQANRRASDWLQERLQTLREQAATAERAVLEFKAKNNIVAAGGSLMSDKQLADTSSRLAAARASTFDVQVRLERIEAVRRAYQQDQPESTADETVSEAMSNPIISGMRTRYLDLVNREADYSGRYGKNHTAVVNLRNQIRELRRSIRDEVGRIEETFRSEYAISKKREDELEKTLATQISQSTQSSQSQVALFSLESAAQSYRKLYDSFLQRHTETVQQQSFPVSDARLLSPASVSKTGPRSLLIMLTTLFAGGGLGVGFGMLLEILDRGFRTREQVRSVLEKDCLALVPLLPNQRTTRLVPKRSAMGIIEARRAELEASVNEPFGDTILVAPRVVKTIIEQPLSPYAESIRSIKLSIDQDQPKAHSKVMGLTSCFSAEGKSTLALATATQIAQTGARVILVDCDVRNPSLTRTLTPDADIGLLDAIAGKASLTDAVWTYPQGKLAFLPRGGNGGLENATDLLSSEAAKSLFVSLQLKYDYVIVDLAPLVSSLDIRATSGLIESYLLVIEWGVTKADALQYTLRNAPGVLEKVVGAVLNKVNVTSLERYDRYGAQYYYGQGRSTLQ